MEVRPARWTWLPETAGFYHVSADSTFSDGQILRGAIDYTVPIDVTLAAEAAPGAVRITASLRNPIRTNSVPGINPVTSYLFVAQRTDIPGAIPVTRGFGDPASADRTWNTRLPVGLYKLFCVVFQNDANAGVVATGEQIIIDHHVTP